MVSTESYSRLTRPPRQSFFLLGVRGVGKSTWARRQFPDALRIDLLDESRYQDYLVDPSLFAGELATCHPGSRVVVDEIQRLPNLLNEVHRFIEERRLKFALLGSSARRLKAAGVNLLAGRALRKTMFPLVPSELGGDFELDAALESGTIPLVWVSDERRAVLESYVQLYLREEIRAEALVRNLPGFARFLPIAALYHGEVVNVSGIARDCGVARTTVQGYLDILEDTLLAFRLPAFEAKLRVRERRHPKLYWVDPGLVRAVKKLHGPISPEERGALLEGWVLQPATGAWRRGAICSTTSITGRLTLRIAPRWTSCSAGGASSRQSRSRPSRAITPACYGDCGQSPSCPGWYGGCSSTAAGGPSSRKMG